MRIKTVIKQLQEALETHGNLSVCVRNEVDETMLHRAKIVTYEPSGFTTTSGRRINTHIVVIES